MTDQAPRTLTLVDPATEQITKSLALAGKTEVDHAVMQARRCFDHSNWADTSIKHRVTILETLLERITVNRERFAALISKEVGTPLPHARSQQVDAALGHIRATLNAARTLQNDVLVSLENEHHRTRYEPIGVAALITPWNWPLNQVVLKVIGALMAGCTMVLKPSELTTDTARLFEQCLIECDLPEGIFQLVAGDGETGKYLVEHPAIDMISFTGSTSVGREIAVQAARNFKRTILELGGKSPNILLADCDVERAVSQGVAHCFRNAGQSCNAASRMIVDRTIYEEVVERAIQTANAFRVGSPDDETAQIGPVISKAQFDRIQDYIRLGIEEKANLVAGGPAHADGFERGYFVKPTVFSDVRRDMTIFREEIFGPVLTLTPFDDVEEAVSLANDTDYGLAGYIQGGDAVLIDTLAKQLRVGMVQVNGSSRIEGAAFGGVKASGIGREAGLWGIRAFQEIKSISGVTRFQNASS